MRRILSTVVILLSVLFMISLEFTGCQNSINNEVKLYFREDWKEIPTETPVTQEHVNNPELILRLYGTSADSIRKSHHDKPADDPYYIWSGLCNTNWALTLHKENSTVDLSSGAKISWRTRQSGGRVLRAVLGTEDGSWFVSEQGTGVTYNWEVSTITLDTLKWQSLDIEKVEAGELLSGVDLSKIKYIGCSDLMPGGGSNACSRLDWIEVYGKY